MKCYYYESTIEGACGVSNFTDFHEDYFSDRARPLPDIIKGGAEFAFAGFVNTNTCREAYTALCKKYKLVYQSPVRVNRNSGNEFFFCIFDARK